jgi:hypothetical protein
MAYVICQAQAAIVRWGKHPSGQTSREIGTQSVESRGHVGMVALPGAAVRDGTPEGMGNERSSVGGHP